MCDCYSVKCENCDNKIAIHIADFCTQRENIKVYCPDCVTLETHFEVVRGPVIFRKNGSEIKRHTGKRVLFICSDPKAYGICLNG